MQALLAFTSHNISFVQQSLLKLKGCPPVSVIDIDAKIKSVTEKPHVLLVPTVETLVRNAQVLNQCPRVIAIVFDAPVLCKEVGAPLLDVEVQTLDYAFRFRKLEPRDVVHHVKRALAATQPVKIEKKKVDTGTRLLKRTHGSIIGKYMTFLYKVPDTDKRQELQKQVFAAWWDNKVDELLTFLAKRYPKNAAATEFVQQLKEPEAQRFTQAVAELKKAKLASKPLAYDKVAKKFQISPFDLRYLLKTVGRK